MSKHFPSQPNLRQLKSQAKDLKKACETRDPQALQRFREHHPRHVNSSDSNLIEASLTLQDAQLVVAREYGFDSWPDLSASIGAVPVRPAAVESIVGSGGAVQRIRSELARAACTDAPVLLVGEKGVGKRLAARWIHAMGARSGGPFVQVICDAAAETLTESEIFGHESGAFTGAKSARVGSLETATAGTLVLDEIGGLSLLAQGWLHNLIESGTYRRLGGSEDLVADLRLVGTSSRDLRKMVEDGRFREDLHYRMEVLRIDLPPLRDRTEDIPDLAQCFATATGAGDKEVPRFSEDAIALLKAHDWPGNVRELRHAVERAVIASGVGDTISSDAIHLRRGGSARGNAAA